MKNNIKKIVLTGGGTGGSVSPLLAIFDELKYSQDYKFVWLGTKNGPEKEMVEKEGIQFMSITSGKMRRYFSWSNFIDIFKIKIAFWQAFFLILKEKPSLIMSAGSFVSVPVAWAAWILRVPVMIHQQDAVPGLANKLMAPFARVITVTLEKSLRDYGKKAIWTGNPIRVEFRRDNYDKEKVLQKFDLKNNLPILLVIGGGTGSETINNLISQSFEELVSVCQVVHVTGKNKAKQLNFPNYKSFEFLTPSDMALILKAADIVVSRCGLGFLSELSYLAKVSILIPILDSHQEVNAQVFQEKDAALILKQDGLSPEKLVHNIKKLLTDKDRRQRLSKNIQGVIKKDAEKKVIELIKNILD